MGDVESYTVPTGTVPENNLKIWNLRRFSNGFILAGKIDHGNKQRSRKAFIFSLTLRGKAVRMKKGIKTYTLSFLSIQGNFTIFKGRREIGFGNGSRQRQGKLLYLQKDGENNHEWPFFSLTSFPVFPYGYFVAKM